MNRLYSNPNLTIADMVEQSLTEVNSLIVNFQNEISNIENSEAALTPETNEPINRAKSFLNSAINYLQSEKERLENIQEEWNNV